MLKFVAGGKQEHFFQNFSKNYFSHHDDVIMTFRILLTFKKVEVLLGIKMKVPKREQKHLKSCRLKTAMEHTVKPSE